jgi:hypothetical protein
MGMVYQSAYNEIFGKFLVNLAIAKSVKLCFTLFYKFYKKISDKTKFRDKS